MIETEEDSISNFFADVVEYLSRKESKDANVYVEENIKKWLKVLVVEAINRISTAYNITQEFIQFIEHVQSEIEQEAAIALEEEERVHRTMRGCILLDRLEVAAASTAKQTFYPSCTTSEPVHVC